MNDAEYDRDHNDDVVPVNYSRILHGAHVEEQTQAPHHISAKRKRCQHRPPNGTLRTHKHSCAICTTQEALIKTERSAMVKTGDGCLHTYPCKYGCGSQLFWPPRGSDQYKGERSGSCCQRGKTPSKLQEIFPEFFHSVPFELQSLYFSNVDFQRNARRLNYLFNFSVLGAGHGHGFADKHLRGVRNVSLYGRTYTRLLPLNDDYQKNPLLWYLIDPDDRRKEAFGSGTRIQDRAMYKTFESYMQNQNPISQAFQKIPVDQFKTANVILRHNRLNNEVAAIMQDDIANVDPRELIIHKKGSSKPITVSPLCSEYEPLRYAVLFPGMNRGWGTDLRDAGVTQRMYYQYLFHYRFHIRPNSKEVNDDRRLMKLFDIDTSDAPHDTPPFIEEHFTFMGRLGNEYMVDMYSRMVDERIQYWRKDRVQAQMASYREYDQDPTDHDGVKKRVYMPANQYGSKRRARKNVNDGIELCNQFGKPDFFITLTANPLWADIQRQLHPGQTWADRPDVVNRIFKARLEKLLEKLRDGEFTDGAKQVYIFRVVEWQKRGLPHVHLAIKCDFPDGTDLFKYVQATIPHATASSSPKDKQLHYLICKNNIHANDGNMCSLGHTTATPCRKPGAYYCDKHFPKPLSETNEFDDRGYPVYRRVSNEDRFVVPYNADITLFWQGKGSIVLKISPKLIHCYIGHANVEICTAVAVICYLCKYVCRPPCSPPHHSNFTLVSWVVPDTHLKSRV